MARNPPLLFVLLALLGLPGCTDGQAQQQPAAQPSPVASEQLATFGGGCFWCMEPPFEDRPGVRSVVSGYSGGKEQNPTYKQVSHGLTGHTEVVQVVFDPSKISYAELVEIFWKSMDPTDKGGQYGDRGTQYRPEIFVHDASQRKVAEASKAKLGKTGPFKKPIVVPITDYVAFWPAEKYHQDYYKTNPRHYKAYRKGSGREGHLRRIWGDDAAGAQSRKAPLKVPAAPASRPAAN